MKQLFFAIGVLLLSCTGASAQPKVGDQAADISIKDMNGKQTTLSSLKGKVVLIDFWASWCGPCRKAMPGLRRLYADYKTKGFEIYGISLDEKKADWKKAVQQDKISWIQVNEPGGWESATAKAWNIEQLPSSFLLDKTGKVIAVDPTEEQLKTLLSSELP